jgi:hypothetical protein
MIELAGKTLKMDDKPKTGKQQLMEVLACLCEHRTVIKFPAICTETMEACTL